MRAHRAREPSCVPGNVQVFFPEGNVLLLAGRRDPASGVPDYNAIVTVERARR